MNLLPETYWETSTPFKNYIRRSANYLEEGLKHLETVEVDYGETLPDQVAELLKDINESMESQAPLPQEMYLRILFTGNLPHRL